MKDNISCNVIGDLLPLYIDDVLSDDSRELVESHLNNCESCRESAEKMGKTIVISNDTDGEKIKKLKKSVSVKKIVVSSLFGLMILFGLGFYLFYYGNAVSSENVNVRTEFQNSENSYLNQEWVMHLYLKNNRPLNTFSKEIYSENSKGEMIIVGKTIYLREIPIKGMIECNNYTFGYSYGESSTSYPAKDYDYTITIVYKDKTAVYSMRDEGLFVKQDKDNIKFYP